MEWSGLFHYSRRDVSSTQARYVAVEVDLHNQFHRKNQPHNGEIDLKKVQLFGQSVKPYGSIELALTHDLRALSGLVRDVLLIRLYNRKKYSNTETPPKAAVLMEKTKFSDRSVP